MPTEPDWYAELADAVKSRKVDATQLAELVDEARAHCDASDERPQDAFGDAHTYASEVSSAVHPDEARFQHVAQRYAWSGRPVVLRLLGAFGAALAGYAGGGWLVFGLVHTWTTLDLLGFLTMCAAVSMFNLRDELRDAGRPSTGRKYLGASLFFLAASVVIGSFLPTVELFQAPTPALILGGICLMAVEWVLGDRWVKAHPPQPHHSREVWLDRLADLLEGRYRLTAAQARDLRAETASHLADSGAEPEAEFGLVDDYAAELAERSGLNRRDKPPGQLGRLAAAFLLPLFFAAVTIVVILREGPLNLRTAILAGLTLIFARLAFSSWQRYRSTDGQPTSSASRPT
ncbi:hypothetical protein [Flindersiella endophytica]